MSKQCICKGSLLNYKSNCRWKLFLIAFAGKLIEKVCEMPQAATKASRALEMVLLKKISSASFKFTRLIGSWRIALQSFELWKIPLRKFDLWRIDLRENWPAGRLTCGKIALWRFALRMIDLWRIDLRRIDLRKIDLRRIDLRRIDLQDQWKNQPDFRDCSKYLCTKSLWRMLNIPTISNY